MSISSRTPEGEPHLCPVCGKLAATEPSYPCGDSTCPSCGHLLWWFRDRLGPGIDLRTRLDALADSLDVVELIMELEEEFDVTIPDEAAQDIRTVADAIRYTEQRRRGAE